MTNSKSVDNYGLMTTKPFVMNRTYCLIDGEQFAIYTIVGCDASSISQTSVKAKDHPRAKKCTAADL